MTAGIIFISTGIADAQTDDETFAGIQFNFSTPGARSLGLGGAFLGLADDATAAFANPAGLTVLSKPEVSAEGRNWGYTNRFTDRGHGFGDPTGRGVDTVPGLVSSTSRKDLTGLSFGSFVYPSKRWAVAVYGHQLANFKTSFVSQGAFSGSGVNLGRLLPVTAHLGLRIVSLGVSTAYRVHDALSIGVGLSSYHLSLDSLTTRYKLLAGADPDPVFGNPDSINIQNSQNQQGDDSYLAVTAGLLWKINRQWSAGAVYRQGPKFKFSSTNSSASGQPFFASIRVPFNVPDVYGAGVAFRPTDAWTITADYDRVQYSKLARNSVDIFQDPSDQRSSATAYRAAASHLGVANANEAHLGVEYVFARLKHPLALRVGGWFDPDHRIRYNGTTTPPDATGDISVNQVIATLFPRGKDEFHYSAGLGFVFSERFQIDAGFDYSKPVKTASLSSVVRF